MCLFYKFKEKCIQSQITLQNQVNHETIYYNKDEHLNNSVNYGNESKLIKHPQYKPNIYDEDPPSMEFNDFEIIVDEICETIDASSVNEDNIIEYEPFDISSESINQNSFSSWSKKSDHEVNATESDQIYNDIEYLLDNNDDQLEKKSLKPSFPCDMCEKTFSRKYTLQQHSHIHTGIKGFFCELCDQQFTRKEHLIVHQRRHTNEKPFKCNVCARDFRKSSDLIRHQRIHLNLKNYSCKICGKKFRRSHDVIIHMRMHTGQKPYSCTICEDVHYLHGSSLGKHNDKWHSNKK